MTSRCASSTSCLAFPSLVLALAIVGTLGPSLQNVMIGMVAVWWVDYARVMRGLTSERAGP
jgi:peptide/nickel transport system permease protein